MESKIEKKGPDLVVPTVWTDTIIGGKVPGRTWTVGFSILHQFWKTCGQPVEVTDKLDFIQHFSQTRRRLALADLERLGLIEVERHRGQPPVARIPSRWTTAKQVYGVPWSVIAEEYDWRRK
jgi:hypothetical protein